MGFKKQNIIPDALFTAVWFLPIHSSIFQTSLFSGSQGSAGDCPKNYNIKLSSKKHIKSDIQGNKCQSYLTWWIFSLY